MDINKKLSKKYITTVAPTLSVKDVDSISRTVTGYFNSFNYLDSDLDVIRKGAFAKSINERGPSSTGRAKIKHLLFHDFTKIVGVPNILQEDEKGLYFESKMPDTQDGNDTLIKYQEGIYDNHSIGFSYVSGKIKGYDRDDNEDDFEKLLSNVENRGAADNAGYFYDITEVKLYEGSTVGIGANENTPFLGLKSSDSVELKTMKAIERIDNLSRVLKNGTASDSCMLELEAQTLQLKQFVVNLLTEKGGDIKNDHSGADRQDTKPKRNFII